MSTKVGELTADINLDDVDFERGLSDAKKSFSKTAREIEGRKIAPGADVSGIKSALGEAEKRAAVAGKAIGLAVAAGFTYAGIKAFDFAKDAFSAYSDSVESTSKVEAVFGDSAGEIKAFAKTSAKSLGMSTNETLKATGSFGNMFDQLKVAPDVSSKMSRGLVTLAADLASFNNADPTEVIESMSGAFRGEYDSVQKFIPSMSDAAVKQKAMELSGVKNADALTQQQIAMGAYAVMLDGAGKAVGDFDRTSTGAANQGRIATAQWQDAMTNFGAAVAPIINDTVIPALTNLSGWAAAHGPEIKKFFEDARQAAVDFGNWWTTNVGTWEDTKNGIKAVGDAVLWLKNEVLDPTVGTLQTFFNWISNDGSWTEFQNGLHMIGDAGAWLKDEVLDPIVGVLQTIGEWDGWQTLRDAFTTLKEDVFDPIAGVLQTIADKLNGITDNELFKAIVGGGTDSGGTNVVDAAKKVLTGGFADGGVVPGATGSPSLQLVHGGETILPTHKMPIDRALASVTNNRTFNASTTINTTANPSEIARRNRSSLSLMSMTGGA